MTTPLIANEIRTLLMLGHKLVVREMETRASAIWPNASALQVAVMRHLDMQAHTMSELSTRLLATTSTLVAVIDKLEAEGFVERQSDPADRRRTPLALTAKGRDVMRALRPDEPEALFNSLANMGDAKAAKLRALLQELVAGMQPEDDFIDRFLENARQRDAAAAAAPATAHKRKG
jgi:DNA-binding MarR family transcriptional regulator